MAGGPAHRSIGLSASKEPSSYGFVTSDRYDRETSPGDEGGGMRIAWSSVVVLACLLAAACTGGSDDGSDGSPTSSATSPTGTATARPRTPMDDLLDALSGPAAGPSQIEYRVTTTVGGEEFADTLIWARAADGRERLETTSEQAEESFSLVMVRDAAGEQLTCLSVSGFRDCVAGDEGPFGEIEDPHALALKNGLASADATLGRTSTEQILGIASTCYELTSEGAMATVCIGEGDLLLSAEWSSEGGDGGGLVAVAVTSELASDAFDPPVSGGD